ncbi:serine hydrolase domain-containing protein [Propionibacteriaceae bacterium Y1685]|uniref:serine hydrolase domain-containing protein n=1 Tax=Microlunatus sp. Y1700 TaxID=3418487 RepID=UPI003B7D0B22
MSNLAALVQRHIDDGTIPGAVGLLGADDPEIVALGSTTYGGAPMTVDALMRIQSMTKIITSVAALRLVEQRRLGLDDPVEQWLPELAERQVLRAPDAELDDTEAARGPITVRHLLTNRCGYGVVLADTPLHRAMINNQTEASAEPLSLGADAWLAALAELPLAHHPGEGWRYHHSYALLGILLSRLTGGPLGDHLAKDLFEPLGMVDTGFWVPADQASRLPAALRFVDGSPVETEPVGGGFHVGPPPFDVSHGELVSTLGDYHRFLRTLLDGKLINDDHLAALRSDQVPPQVKQPDSFYPGFWTYTGWGYGVVVEISGPHRGRFGWSGGQGTDFFVDPDGTIGILLTQVEMGERLFPLLEEFQQLRD